MAKYLTKRWSIRTYKDLCLIICISFYSIHIGETLSVLSPCVNCEELHVKLGQNSHQQSQDIQVNTSWTLRNKTTFHESIMDDRTTHCPETCHCSDVYPQCQDGVPVVMDGCGCCPVCARQQGDICNSVQVCDVTRKLQCIYADIFSLSGICRVRRGQGCHVGQSNYRDGETFKLDCRTQCTCQNGTYGCVSLCPHENVRPSSKCHHPQLVKMHGSCCREWLCDSTIMEDRKKHCQPYTSEWTSCSTTCGIGISSRISNNNPECQLKNETRLCILRPCPITEDFQLVAPHGHHVRKNHICRATLRSSTPIRLTDEGNCTSVELYQPKYCGSCTTHHCCFPKVTTSKKIQFRCIDEEGTNIMQKDFLWIIKCDCTATC